MRLDKGVADKAADPKTYVSGNDIARGKFQSCFSTWACCIVFPFNVNVIIILLLFDGHQLKGLPYKKPITHVCCTVNTRYLTYVSGLSSRLVASPLAMAFAIVAELLVLGQ